MALDVSLDLGIDVPNHILITSKTDLKSRITYCNRDFCLISGFSEEDVLGKPHNIMRHKDMPKAVYKILWDHIKKGKEVFALVKNRTKDNGHYWVFANVTPSIDTNCTIVGYYSVRRRANPNAIGAIAPLYQTMLHAEASGGMESSLTLLEEQLKKTGKSYNEFIFALQKA